jgi:Fic family protein
MIYRVPQLKPSVVRRLREVDRLRTELGEHVKQPGPWVGALRRLARASSVGSSVAIEGFTVSEEDAIAIVSNDESPDTSDDDLQAVACYAQAMEHVTVLARDPTFEWHPRVVLDLHFEAGRFQREHAPGLWRTTPIFVTARGGGIAYTAPDAHDIPRLIDELFAWLRNGDLDAHVVIRAALAHLNLVSIHPFRDGNGRIARILQSLVLARDADVAPEFASIEEFLGQHTAEYYDVLRAVQGGSWQPDRDPTRWITFCVDAHIAQAQRRLDQLARAEARWRYLEALAADREWPDRLVIALEQSVMGGTDRAGYALESAVSPATASNDFRRLVDAGLIVQSGRGRNIRYHASESLRRSLDAVDGGVRP